MPRFLIALITLVLLAPPVSAREDAAPLDALRTAIAAAVTERIGATVVDVEIVQAPADAASAVTVVPAPGARLGDAVRFVVTPAAGLPFTVVARVSAVVPHVVATRPLARSAELTADDVEAREARVDGVALEPLPSLEDVLAARPRRAIAQGEVIGRAVLVRPFTVRAGDEVTMTIRTGAVEVRGVGRAVSSGFIGDVIRVSRPGQRDLRHARVTGPAAVEMLP